MTKNLLAILLGFVVVFIGAAGAEVYCRVTGKKAKVSIPYPGPQVAVTSPEGKVSEQFIMELEASPVAKWKSQLSPSERGIKYREGVEKVGVYLGCIMCPELLPEGRYTMTASSKISHKLIYDIHFNVDSHNRRRTPVSLEATQAIVMFGDSVTFGEGVEDAETAPYFLAELRKDTQVLNMGMSGSGPGEFLFEVSQKPFVRLADLSQKKKIFIYTFIDDHMERMICRSNCMDNDRAWVRNKPYYEDVDGVPEFRGTFEDRVFLNTVYRGLRKSAFLNANDVIFPPFFSGKHFDFFAAMMEQGQKNLQKNFPGSEFYVVFFPGRSGSYGAAAAQACKERGLKVLNYDSIDVYTLTGRRDHVIGDGHPSPLTHYIFAKLLHRDLPR
ncbi:MAG: hypothetical protein HUU57_15640 [Bdellovibrio sp.]|nr:hypothetical protein [Bdellovibrio sp.]